jgi:lipid-binding SYLF domain-containing protein
MNWKLTAVAGLVATMCFGQEETPDRRLRHAADALRDIMAAPDKGIPRDLLERSRCVIVIPGMKKGAFVFGADYGRGYATCRSAGGWTGPAALRIGGGSFGAQLGLESTDVVMLVMNQHGMDRLAGDKFTIGADASAAIGPVGRTTTADTDASLKAEMLSWSRTRGAFAGVALDGATITPDHSEDEKLYGHPVNNRQIVRGEVPAPAAAGAFTAILSAYPPR